MKLYIAITAVGVIWFAGIYIMIMNQAGALLSAIA